jgi:hypothetical protein
VHGAPPMGRRSGLVSSPASGRPALVAGRGGRRSGRPGSSTLTGAVSASPSHHRRRAPTASRPHPGRGLLGSQAGAGVSMVTVLASEHRAGLIAGAVEEVAAPRIWTYSCALDQADCAAAHIDPEPAGVGGTGSRRFASFTRPFPHSPFCCGDLILPGWSAPLETSAV